MASSRSRAFLTLWVAVALPALLAACTSGGGAGAADPAPSQASRTATVADAAGPSDEELGERAQAALAGFGGGTMVEAGVEKVTDGVHTEPLLDAGEPYRIRVACVGQGGAQLAFTPETSGGKVAVPCDGAVIHQRITGGRPLRIDVDGDKGAAGMIAWQLDRV